MRFRKGLLSSFGVSGMLILVLLLWKQIAYFFSVNIFDFFNSYHYWKIYSISGEHFVYIYVFELVANLTFLTVLVSKQVQFERLPKIKVTSEQISILLLLLLTFNIGRFAETYSFGRITNPLGILSSFSTYLLQPVSVISLYYIKRFSRLQSVIVAITFISTLISINTRGYVVYGILVLLSMYLFANFSKIKLLLFRSIIIVPLLLLIFKGVPQISYSIDKSETSNRGNLSLELYDNNAKSAGRELLDELDFRFGMMPRMSSKFIFMSSQYGHVGLSPVFHSLVGFIPRSLWPNKPVPSTDTGLDINDQAMYRIYRESLGRDTTSMVEFSVPGHYFWELHIIGVVLFSIFSAIYTKTILAIFKGEILGISVLLTTMKPWGFMDPKIWMSDIPLQVYQVFIPLFLILLLFRIVGVINASLKQVIFNHE